MIYASGRQKPLRITDHEAVTEEEETETGLSTETTALPNRCCNGHHMYIGKGGDQRTHGKIWRTKWRQQDLSTTQKRRRRQPGSP